jgi:hypothetical protein
MKTPKSKATLVFILLTASIMMLLKESDGVSQLNIKSAELACLKEIFTGAVGAVKQHDIPLAFTGRVTLGDLNSDGNADFVVSGRDRLAAYDLCGRQLWEQQASTNWDYSVHKYWHLTSYGYIGDADGDGEGEFLHIGDDWKTLYIRNGKTGAIEQQIGLPNRKWMYVLLGRRTGDTGERATRIIVTTTAYNQDVHINAYDVRSGEPKLEWAYFAPHSQVGKYAYVTPQVADIDGNGGDEILFATLALSEQGEQEWIYNTSAMSAGGIHMLTVKDIDPELPGLETVVSIYGPHKGQPSLVSYSNATKPKENWRAHSPDTDKHPHQHTVGDFDIASPGLETLARNNNGFRHWMVDYRGQVLRENWRIDPGWTRRGEYVQAIEWDEHPGTEVLYLERHVFGFDRPRMRIISPITDSPVTPIFAGGAQNNSNWIGDTWFGFNPFEAGGHVVDVIGDGREEILTWGNNKISLFFNSGDADVPRRWGNADYMQIKKLFCALYNPR